MLLHIVLDLFSTRRHSRYFNQTRSDYLFRRVRAIAWLLAVIQPAWLVMDYWLLPDSAFLPIVYCRLGTAALCLTLGASTLFRYRLPAAHLRLLLLVALLSAFQLISSWLLLQDGDSARVAGYHFFPFMIVAMLAVFPLTILETLFYTGLVVTIQTITQVLRHQFGELEAVNDLWLLGVLGVIAAWAAINQLSMLLGLYRQATRDPLTGLANRRQAMEQYHNEIERCRAHHQPLSVLLLDLDKFKLFNDNHGHAAGDIVLKSFSQLLRQQLRKRKDLPCRYGGEEFLVILPEFDGQQAEQTAWKIINACRQTHIRTPAGKQLGFTCSIGVATLQDNETGEQLIQRSDTALYQAKEQGRNQACFTE